MEPERGGILQLWGEKRYLNVPIWLQATSVTSVTLGNKADHKRPFGSVYAPSARILEERRVMGIQNPIPGCSDALRTVTDIPECPTKV